MTFSRCLPLHLHHGSVWPAPACVKTGSDQEKTFGPTISGLIHRHIEPERLLLWDSKVRGGRPDTMKILKQVYQDWNAEGTRIPCASLAVVLQTLTMAPVHTVVFITSNYIGNSEMMQVRVKAKISCSPPCPVRRCRR